MTNIFYEIEEKISYEDEIIFDKIKIKERINELIIEKLNFIKSNKNFFFEEIVYDFFDYLNIPLIRTKKTRDSGIDGIIKLKLNILGNVNVGLQIKNKIIDSTDIDLFSSSLNLSELQLGIIVCKDSRHFEKYDLNTKIKTILLSKGIEPSEKLINEKVDINPVSIIKFDDLVEIVALQIRGFIKSIYKK